MTGGELCSLKDNTEKCVCCFQFFSFDPFLIKSFSGAEGKKAAEDLSLTFFFLFFLAICQDSALSCAQLSFFWCSLAPSSCQRTCNRCPA